jgi:hypothetical protein
MVQLGLLLFDGFKAESLSVMGMWLFLSIGAFCLFVIFIPFTSWVDARRREREAFYQAEMLRRLTEGSPESAREARALMEQQERIKSLKAREGLKMGGLINIAVGAGLMIFLHALTMRPGSDGPPVYLTGIIPGLIGVAMLAYVYIFARRLE